MKKGWLTLLITTMFIGFIVLVSGCAEKQTPGDQSYIQSSSAEKIDVPSEEPVIPEEPVSQVVEEQPVFDSSSIYFDYDKSDLKPEAQSNLKDKGIWLEKNPSHTLAISGHCDSRGSNVYNIALGERRATQAKKFLVDMGISADRISTISYGEERPVDPGENEEAWAKNRRDEFKLDN